MLGDQMVVMNAGGILQSGPPQDVFSHPKHKEVASAVGVDTVVSGRVLLRRGGIVVLRVGTAELSAADPEGIGQEFYVCIRGEDVTLERGRAEQSSARNHLMGVVAEVSPVGVLTRVTVDVGFEIVALVTRQAAADLALLQGTEIYAVFKASAVHLIRHVPIP
jgi:molybdopterin-binding protein